MPTHHCLTTSTQFIIAKHFRMSQVWNENLLLSFNSVSNITPFSCSFKSNLRYPKIDCSKLNFRKHSSCFLFTEFACNDWVAVTLKDISMKLLESCHWITSECTKASQKKNMCNGCNIFQFWSVVWPI